MQMLCALAIFATVLFETAMIASRCASVLPRPCPYALLVLAMRVPIWSSWGCHAYAIRRCLVLPCPCPSSCSFLPRPCQYTLAMLPHKCQYVLATLPHSFQYALANLPHSCQYDIAILPCLCHGTLACSPRSCHSVPATVPPACQSALAIATPTRQYALATLPPTCQYEHPSMLHTRLGTLCADGGTRSYFAFFCRESF